MPPKANIYPRAVETTLVTKVNYHGIVVPPDKVYGRTPVVRAYVVGLYKLMVLVAALVAIEVAIELMVGKELPPVSSNTIVNILLVEIPVIFSKNPSGLSVIGPENY